MSEFDAYKDTYREEIEGAIGFAGQDLDYFTAAKARSIVDLAKRRIGPPEQLTVLDVGCGTGETDAFLSSSFARLIGIDPSHGSIERAVERNPDVEYLVGPGGELPLASQSVDLAFAICVMHHVPPAEWQATVAEIGRVLRPGGLVAIYEHNPLNPLTRKVVSNCEFDEHAVLLSRRRLTGVLTGAGLEVVEARYMLFLPFGGERVAPLERLLRRVPLGAQHYAAARVPQLNGGGTSSAG